MEADDNSNSIRSRTPLNPTIERTARLLREIDEIEVRLARLERDMFRLRRPRLIHRRRRR
jgi:hypothetical protein